MSSKRRYGSKNNNDQIQLYHLLRQVSSHILDEDECSTVIGYSIIDGLKGFKTDSGSNDEIKFQEVKKIYQALNELVDSCMKDERFNALVEMKYRVDPFIKDNYSDTEGKISDECGSVLLKGILSKKLSANRRNYMDVLRRAGKKLYDDVLEKGPFNRNVDILTNDYKSINDCFK
jgi:hypothetical protein